MPAPSSTDKESPNAPEGRKYRFVVSSAEEAVKVIREELGEHARVLSVEQTGGKGLARFLSSPQLEVIATVPSKAELDRERQKKQRERRLPAKKTATAVGPPKRMPVAAPKPVATAPSAKTAVKVPTKAPRAYAKAAEASKPQDNTKLRDSEKPLTPSGKESLNSLLRKARFDDDLLARIENSTDWDRISKMELNHGLSEVFCWLRQEYQKLQPKDLATRIAFMGTPGSGKTSALCKRMANDVFVHGKQIQVLKVENDTPNPDDALRVLCDILNVELLRDPIDLEKVDPDGYLYVDVPGVPLHEREQWTRLNGRLNELWVESRVLVLNAAYEREVLKDTISLADEMGCTHQVFTHLDELSNVTKLWQLILNSTLSTLFFSYGQNVTSEFTPDLLDYLSSRTFPSYLTQ